MKGFVSNGLDFEIKDNIAILSGIGSCTDSYVTVPLTFRGLPVSEIAPKAFANATGLTEVVLPPSVKVVGEEAFAWCRSLQSIKLLGVAHIKNRAFIGCDCLRDVDFSPALLLIGEKAFAYCSDLASLKLPQTVETIRISAFEGCRALRVVSLPRKLKMLENGVFYACTALRKITLPANLEYIDEYAFAYCAELTEIAIPPKTVINRDAFFECTELEMNGKVS